MREIKVLLKIQCKIVILDALIQNTTSEKNLNGGRVPLSTNKKPENYLCPNLVRRNRQKNYSIKGKKKKPQQTVDHWTA